MYLWPPESCQKGEGKEHERVEGVIPDCRDLFSAEWTVADRNDAAGQSVPDAPLEGPDVGTHRDKHSDADSDNVKTRQGPGNLLDSCDHQYAPEEVNTAPNVFARILTSCRIDQLST